MSSDFDPSLFLGKEEEITSEQLVEKEVKKIEKPTPKKQTEQKPRVPKPEKKETSIDNDTLKKEIADLKKSLQDYVVKHDREIASLMNLVGKETKNEINTIDFTFSNVFEYFVENAMTKYKNELNYLRRIVRKSSSLKRLPQELQDILVNESGFKNFSTDTTTVEFWFGVFKDALDKFIKNKN